MNRPSHPDIDLDAPLPPLRVLVIGRNVEADACDLFRTGMYVAPLRSLGIEVRYACNATDDDRPLSAQDVETRTAAELDGLLDQAGHADVLVFRRWYATHIVCLDCDFASVDAVAASQHGDTAGHSLNVPPDLAVRRLLDLIDADPGIVQGRAILYETDDDLGLMEPTNGLYRTFRHETDLLERMMRRADLMTVSTPVLATRFATATSEVRVLRNAVDPDWYAAPGSGAGAAAADGSAAPRLCFYGSIGRLRDYAVCAPVVEDVARSGARRVWFGAPALPRAVARVAHQFDEIHPFVVGIADFARRLRELGPDIGLAPLVDTRFARAKSELHWLEYTMAGAVTVASALAGRGPYDPIRNGVDGFLVSGNAEWRRTLRRLTGSPGLRAEVSARARARVLEEYSVAARAVEWAAAYRGAAANAGRGLEHARQAAAAADLRPVAAARPVGGNRSMRREERRRAASAAVAKPAPRVETPEAAVVDAPAPDAASIVDAYVAAQAFATRSPLRLWLGGLADERPGAAPAVDDPGWVTIDVAGQPDLRHDVLYGLPFGDGTVEAIEVRDVFDRLGLLAPLLAAEAMRVLRPDGVLRVTAPDRLAALARRRSLLSQGIDLVGSAARLPAFSSETMVELLAQAGLREVHAQEAGGEQLVVAARR